MPSTQPICGDNTGQRSVLRSPPPRQSAIAKMPRSDDTVRIKPSYLLLSNVFKFKWENEMTNAALLVGFSRLLQQESVTVTF